MSAIVEFEEFLQNLKLGQPLNRLVLAQDDVRGVLHDQDPKNVQLTPQLAKVRTHELAQRLTQAPTFAPAPNPGLGTSNMSNLNLQNYAPKPPVTPGGGEGGEG